jgi:hypothetical protein
VRRVVGLAMREADERARLEERQAVAAQLQTWSAVMIGNGNLDGGNALRRAAAVLLSGDA